MNYIGNAMSLGMLDGAAMLNVMPLTPEQAQSWAVRHELESCVGHADTAALMSELLGVPVAHCRRGVSLRDGDSLLVAQYNGPRLPEGATELPEGASIRWRLVMVH